MKRVLVMFVAACVAVVFSHVLRVNAEEGKGEHEVDPIVYTIYCLS